MCAAAVDSSHPGPKECRTPGVINCLSEERTWSQQRNAAPHGDSSVGSVRAGVRLRVVAPGPPLWILRLLLVGTCPRAARLVVTRRLLCLHPDLRTSPGQKKRRSWKGGGDAIREDKCPRLPGLGFTGCNWARCPSRVARGLTEYMTVTGHTEGRGDAVVLSVRREGPRQLSAVSVSMIQKSPSETCA